MKTKVVKVLAGVVFVSASIMGAAEVDSYLDSEAALKVSVDLILSSNEANLKLPMVIDEETRLDTTRGVGRHFTYNYTMVNYEVANFNVAKFTKDMTKQVSNSVCGTKNMKPFVDLQVTVVYSYNDKDGKHISDIPVDTRDCEQILQANFKRPAAIGV